MTEEVKLKVDKVKTPQINLLKYISSATVELNKPRENLEDFDYYSIVEKGNTKYNGIIICWNEGQDIEEGLAFIAEWTGED